MTTLTDQPAAPIVDSRRARFRRGALKASTTIVSTDLMISILFGLDLYLHHKHGVNLWGYRGPVAGRKQSGEKRVAVLGGSTTWGFGLQAGQSFPAQLQQRLAERPPLGGVTSIKLLNLAENSEGAYSFKYTLNDYAYLDYDVVLLYSGYNDWADKTCTSLGIAHQFFFGPVISRCCLQSRRASSVPGKTA